MLSFLFLRNDAPDDLDPLRLSLSSDTPPAYRSAHHLVGLFLLFLRCTLPLAIATPSSPRSVDLLVFRVCAVCQVGITHHGRSSPSVRAQQAAATRNGSEAARKRCFKQARCSGQPGECAIVWGCRGAWESVCHGRSGNPVDRFARRPTRRQIRAPPQCCRCPLRCFGSLVSPAAHPGAFLRIQQSHQAVAPELIC